LGNEVDYSIDHLVLVLPHVKAGKLRALAVTSPKRAAQLADVPAMQEAGLGDYEMRGWYGLLAPAGVSGTIVGKLNAETVKALKEPDVVKQLDPVGSSESVACSPEAFRQFMVAEIAKWRDVVTTQGIAIS